MDEKRDTPVKRQRRGKVGRRTDDDLADLRPAGAAYAAANPVSPETAARVLAIMRVQRRRRALKRALDDAGRAL